MREKAEEWQEYQKRFPAMLDQKIFLSIDEYAYSGTPVNLKLALAYGMVFVMKEAPRPASKRKPSKKSGKSKGPRASAAQTQSGTRERAASASGSDPHRIEQALRAWRLSEAKRRRVPAFRIFGDRALLSIATTAPRNEAELLAVQGIGPGIDDHGQGPRLHPTDRKLLIVDNRIGTR